MKNQLCVSSFSLRRLLGPIRITRRGPDGKKQNVSWDDVRRTRRLVDEAFA